MEVRASLLFCDVFELPEQDDSPPRKDSGLAARSPWKNKGEGISKYQPSTIQGGRSG